MEVNGRLRPVKKDDSKPLVRDYYAKFQKRTNTIIIATQTLFVVGIVGTLQLIGMINLWWPWVIGIIIIGSTLLSVLTFLLVRSINRPFHDLVQAIVLISGERLDTVPPNPNNYENDKDGFKDILQIIYELSSTGKRSVVPGASDESTESADSSILDGLNDTSTGIVIMDRSGQIMYRNRQAPVREGTDAKLHLDLVFSDIADTFDTWRDTVMTGTNDAEYQWSRVSDKLPGEENRRLFDIAASYRKNNDAQIIITLFDRTNLYTPEEEDLDFISFAAHELRGPITVIRGYLDVLHDELQPVLKQDQSALMLRLMVASNRLTSYINNILNAAKFDRRHMKLRLSEETVRHIYDSIADDMLMRASTQNRLLVADIPEDLPTVAADPNAIGEVLGNLIDNAIKYSNEGGLIHLVARTTPGFVEVSIVDRGIGMPTNVMPNLFHKFYRSHRSRETVAGTGIGLYICKAIVSSHGGTITARSVENEGSTFSFTMPIYDTVADKLKAGNNSNASLIEHGSGWIRNHSMYRG